MPILDRTTALAGIALVIMNVAHALVNRSGPPYLNLLLTTLSAIGLLGATGLWRGRRFEGHLLTMLASWSCFWGAVLVMAAGLPGGTPAHAQFVRVTAVLALVTAVLGVLRRRGERQRDGSA